ncbi:YigZ family protein [Motiliproteus sp.]|uniref:YigZ family protein n=1 Tax=Motiliproteus sp. TaxID=1898955 RepID=UPI003BAC271B
MQPPRPTYAVPAAAVAVEYEIKKSRFIARVAKAADREAAMAMLAQAREDYPDARHHCWAYLIGNPHSPTTVAMSDDGEPSGTAGKPILNVLQHKGVGDLMLVVIRYFGGIKLGAGGLVRAYSHAAQLAMTELSIEDQVPYSQCEVVGDYALEQPLRHWLGQHNGQMLSVEYTEQVRFQVSVPDEQQAPLRAFVEGAGGQWISDA